MMLASSNISQQTKSKKHARGKRKHYLTEYIITTDEYVNLQKPNDKYCYFGGKEQAENILNKEELEASKKLRLDEEEDKFYILIHLVSSKSEKDKSVIAYYCWLNPYLALPSYKQLAGHILKSATNTN
ncbi:11056_t:CDS:2 [Dentiscutata erythropus]|uniref:11056_t:CDS:1 n=1 Tax=Dentiscutata erythropus TaxID=1348616 RepID=A0A9N9JNX3_9GLOM|nr:11056_t:CDS:2 [Dentiscutata erythropus]